MQPQSLVEANNDNRSDNPGNAGVRGLGSSGLQSLNELLYR